MAFIDAYLVSNNGTSAAKSVGFSPISAATTACRLLKKDNIRAEINRRRQNAIEKLDLNPERVLNRLMIEMDGLGPDSNAGARIKAAELLAKMQGMLTDKHQIETTIGPPPVIQFLPATRRTDDEDAGDC